jgi:hypothetical protein
VRRDAGRVRHIQPKATLFLRLRRRATPQHFHSLKLRRRDARRRFPIAALLVVILVVPTIEGEGRLHLVIDLRGRPCLHGVRIDEGFSIHI